MSRRECCLLLPLVIHVMLLPGCKFQGSQDIDRTNETIQQFNLKNLASCCVTGIEGTERVFREIICKLNITPTHRSIVLNSLLNRLKHQILAHKNRPDCCMIEGRIQLSKTKPSFPHHKEGLSLGSKM